VLRAYWKSFTTVWRNPSSFFGIIGKGLNHVLRLTNCIVPTAFVGTDGRPQFCQLSMVVGGSGISTDDCAAAPFAVTMKALWAARKRRLKRRSG
jgi:hypothetical protein